MTANPDPVSVAARLLRAARLRRVLGLDELIAHPGVRAAAAWWAGALGSADNGPPYGTWPQPAVENGLIFASITRADLEPQFLVPSPGAREQFRELVLEAIANAARAGMVERIKGGSRGGLNAEVTTDPLGKDPVLTHALHLSGLSWLTLPYAAHMTVTRDHTIVLTLGGRRVLWNRR